jgi:hypothetical protein
MKTIYNIAIAGIIAMNAGALVIFIAAITAR